MFFESTTDNFFEENQMRQIAVMLVLVQASLQAFAGTQPPNFVPEPGIMPLLAIAAVGALVAWSRNRNK